MSWDDFYNFFYIKDFIYFISSPQIQDMLFPVKLVFVSVAAFSLIFVVYYMLNSSWLQYKFLEDITEFFSWKAYGLREIARRLSNIRKRTESGQETDLKLAIIDSDDFLFQVLDQQGYDGKNFEESIEKASKLMGSIFSDVVKAHEVRNSIVYDPDFKISADEAKKILDMYETAINEIGLT